MTNLTNYLKATFAEMKQVKWPTRAQASVYTLLVIILSAVVAVYAGFFDFIFSSGINFLINRF
jgi:preprotein translocase SecE subunit